MPANPLQIAQDILDKAGKKLAREKIDSLQKTAYDYAWLSSELFAAKALTEYSKNLPRLEQGLADIFSLEVIEDLWAKIGFHADEFGVSQKDLEAVKSQAGFHQKYSIAAEMIRESGGGGCFGLDGNHEMFRQTFRKFAEDMKKR
jgi:(2S)-methylsuccinyl-CoA dehydrogenase